MTIFTGIKELWSLRGASGKQGRKIEMSDLSLVKDAAFAVSQGRIQWVGRSKDIKSKTLGPLKRITQKVDLKGAVVMPAFVDAHTHAVFAGNRQDEFELRHKGFSYQEIADRGGGIMSTVRATRTASLASLQKLILQRESEYLKQGVATLEIKSGYGLDLKNEIKILTAASKVKKLRAIPCFLGAHAVPPEFNNSADYIQALVKWLPKIRKFAERLDIFIEKSYFSEADALLLFEAGKKLGFQIVAHTDQLNPTGASVFAAQQGAVSVDHCLRLKDEEVLALAKSETTCVLLPGSDFYLHLPYPPARRLIDAGARVAIATDFNPGSCPTQDLSLIGVLARLEMKMTLPEVIVGFTLNGAYALGLSKDIGSIEVGKFADFITLDDKIESLFYQVGHHSVGSLWREGRRIFTKK